MKITAVRTIALGGATHDHGWPGGTDPNVQYNTLVEVVSDDGPRRHRQLLHDAGAGRRLAAIVARASCSASRAWSRSASARSCGKSMFWLGRGGSVEHTISGIDIALWDLCGKALEQPVSRLLGGNYRDRIKPYASILFDEPGKLREKLQAATGARLSRDQDGLAAVRPRERQVRRTADPHGPRDGRRRGGADGRRRRQRAVLAARRELGQAHGRRCSATTTSSGSKKP